jgi:DNA-binding beta-propeller fold protein YncE
MFPFHPIVARVVGLAVAVALAAVGCAAGASLASAAQTHEFAATIGAGAGAGAGELSLVPGGSDVAGSGVAVDAETGDVYVADTANNRVEEFDPAKPSSEQFIRAWGWGVKDGKAELETCTSSCQAGIAGHEPGELEGPTFIAVDNSSGASKGDVYVAGPGQHLESPENIVTKYDAEGSLVESWGVKGQLNGPAGEPEDQFGQLAGIAVSDETADLSVYVGGTIQAPNSHTYQFDQGGVFLAPSIEGGAYSPQGLAVDDTGELFLSVNAEGIERLPGGMVYQAPSFTITGFAADPFTDDLYVDEGSVILDISRQCEPSFGGCVATQTFGTGHLSQAAGLTVHPSTGTIYVADTGSDVIAVFPVSLEANVLAASEVGAITATLHGEVNPEGTPVTTCSFQYGPSKSYGNSVPCLNASGVTVGTPAQPITGAAPVALHADVEGLASGSTQHFRVHAASASDSISSEDETLKTLPAAVIEETSSSEVKAGSALLAAKVNPEGLALSSCEFQYGTTTAYGESLPCEQSLGAIGSGTTGVPVSLHVTGLSPETTYHWRVVVSDANLTSEGGDNTFIFLPPGPPPVQKDCPNEQVRGESELNPKTGAPSSSELPDCRAYELVTPPVKNAALIGNIIISFSDVLAENGERVISYTTQCFNKPPSCSGDREFVGAPYEFARGSEGWTARALGPPASPQAGATVWSFSVDTDTGLFSILDPPAAEQFYAREPDGTLHPIGPVGEGEGLNFLGKLNANHVSTSDLSRIVYTTLGSLWSFDGTVAGAKSVYEYAGAGNAKPELVGVSGGAGSNDLISACGTLIGGINGGEILASSGSLSGDGRTVYFTAVKCGTGTGVNAGHAVPADELYERVDGSRTVLISAAAPGGEVCGAQCAVQPAGDAAFQGASADGSRAFFTSTQQLTDGASEDTRSGDSAEHCSAIRAGVAGCNLYESECAGHCEDVAQRRLVDVSGGDSSGAGPGVQGVVAIASDGSRVYFVAKGVLSGIANAAGQEPLEGGDNLYVYGGGHVAFIATLPSSDEGNWHGVGQANVTPDGRFLVFASHGALTADATRAGGVGPAQIYRYDAQAGVLARVSIGVRGFNDDGNAGAGDAQIVPSRIGFAGQSGPGRADPTMSHDGSRVFFESPVGLTPNAVNDVPISSGGESRDLAENIYEWEADGAGGCSEVGGCVWLISDGRDLAEGSGPTASAVQLKGSDGTGSNVLFTSADPLVAQDGDTQRDFYDARVDGGFPVPVAQPVCGSAEECHVGGSEPSVFGPLASLAPSGSGNLLPGTPKPAPVEPSKPLTNKQKLAKALKACHRDRAKKKRVACERQARKRYGPAHKAKAKAHKASK